MEIYNDSTPILFWIVAGFTGIAAVLTMLTQNIVRAATWMLFALCGAGATFFLLGADFVAATQILVYAGGTLILVVFGVMLTAQGPFLAMRTSAAEWALSLIVGVSLFIVLAICIVDGAQVEPEIIPPVVAKYAPSAPLSSDPATSPYTDVIGQGLLGKGVGPAQGEGDRIIRTAYLLPFEIVSVHLLVVLIGAAYLARAKRRKGMLP